MPPRKPDAPGQFAFADPAPLFSPARHRAQRDRLARLPADANFLAPIIAETLLDRLSMVTRTFSRTLLIGAHDPAFAERLRATGTELALIEAGPCLAGRRSTMIGAAAAKHRKGGGEGKRG